MAAAIDNPITTITSDNDENNPKNSSNPAFAFVLNSILNKNKNQKLLSKAKKECEISLNKSAKAGEDVTFIDSEGKLIKNDQSNSKNESNKTNTKRSAKNNTIKRRKDGQKTLNTTWLSKSADTNEEHEKQLKLIATKGVVQLFNVVREKQRILKNKLSEAGASESKRTRMLAEFDEEELQQDERIRPTKKSNQKPSQTKRKWSVLSDDFMTGAKFKDWNEQDDDGDDN